MHAEGEGLVHTSRFLSLLSGMGMARANVGGNESNDALVIQTTCHTHQLLGRNFIEFHRISYQHGTSMLAIHTLRGSRLVW